MKSGRVEESKGSTPCRASARLYASLYHHIVQPVNIVFAECASNEISVMSSEGCIENTATVTHRILVLLSDVGGYTTVVGIAGAAAMTLALAHAKTFCARGIHVDPRLNLDLYIGGYSLQHWRKLNNAFITRLVRWQHAAVLSFFPPLTMDYEDEKETEKEESVKQNGAYLRMLLRLLRFLVVAVTDASAGSPI